MQPLDSSDPPEKSTTRKRASTQRVKETPLTETDWIDAANEILVDENVRGIRIDALCRKLGVTKGSFYWHFQGRPQLLTALLRRWRKRMTTNVIDRLSTLGQSPTERLRALFDLPRRPRSPAFARIEQSVRDWGRRENQAMDAVREVDEIRFKYFRTLLEEHGLDAETAERRAYIAYAIMMGDSVLRQTIDRQDGADAVIDEVMDLITRK